VVTYLPSGLRYNYGSATIDGSYAGNGIVSGGLLLGNLNPGRTLTIRFRAQIESGPAFGLINFTLTNRTSAYANNTASVYDSASSTIYGTYASIDGGARNFGYYYFAYQDAAAPRQLSVQKLGRNIAKGESGEFSSLSASPNDTLEFIFKVRSLSSSTIYNVNISDIMPGGLNYIRGTSSINGIITSDGIIDGQGINIGSLTPHQEIVIRFNAVVGPTSVFPSGVSSIINTVRVRASDTPAAAAELPISITSGQVAGVSIAKVAGVATGTAGSLAMSLFLSALITCGYMNYTKTGLFRKREAWAVIKEHRLNKNKFNFAN
jgi:uncharacterized repeat protein (TIGR01451 family)